MALTVLALLPALAHAKTRPTKWAHGWRPGWLPSDPGAGSGPGETVPLWAPTASGANHSAGLLITIDPITHRPIAPTAEQKRAFAAQQAQDALLAPTRPLTVQRLPNGGEIIHLDGAFRMYSIARRGADGKITTDCAPDAETARKLLSQPAPRSPATHPAWEEK
jgi:hypothetical protein